jgi:hypothetical protein
VKQHLTPIREPLIVKANSALIVFYRGRTENFGEETLSPTVDLFDIGPKYLDGLACKIVNLPVQLPLAQLHRVVSDLNG